MHLLTVDALEGNKVHDGNVEYDGLTVRVDLSFAGRVVTFDESVSTSDEDLNSPDFAELYKTQFVVLADGTGHPVWSRRNLEVRDGRMYTLSLLQVPTGWVPHRILLQPSGGWTPMPDLLCTVMRTAFPTATPQDFQAIRTTRRASPPGSMLFALCATRVFSKPERGRNT